MAAVLGRLRNGWRAAERQIQHFLYPETYEAAVQEREESHPVPPARWGRLGKAMKQVLDKLYKVERAVVREEKHAEQNDPAFLRHQAATAAAAAQEQPGARILNVSN